MDQRLGGLGRHLALGLTGTLTMWAAVWAWRGFLEEPGTYLRPLFVLALLIGVTGALGRWARLPGVLLVAGQVVVAALVGAVLLTGTLLPGLDDRGGPVALFRGAVETAQVYAAPVPADAPGLHPLLVAGGLALMLLVDVLAGTMRRASLAGLPLLTAVALPVSMLGGGVRPAVFAVTAAGFLALLVLQEDDQVERWGRNLAGDGRSSVLGRPAAARAGAAAIGTVVTALALIVPTGVPSLGLTLFDGPFGTENDDIKLDNPMVDLRRDLKRGEDVPLVTATTDDPDPRYLRITVLSRFALNAWSNGDRDLPDDQRADGAVPGLDGVDPRLRGETYEWELETRQAFESAWLPTPYPVSRVEAPGNWKYDLSTMDFLAASDDLDAAGLTYGLTSTQVDVSATQLAGAAPGTAFVDPEFTELPEDLPPLVADLARGVASGQETDFEQARALQQWFRSDGGFEYTLERDDGNGGDELVEFLSQGPEGRRGYCEQFASAMAVMARSLGIPSRVAIGFLRPDQVAPGTYEYSSYDLHSWPELYFQGAGWVRFEPTPAGRAPGVPAYTQGQVQLSDEVPGVQGGVGGDALPDRGGAGGDAGAAAQDEAGPDTAAASQGGPPWGLIAGALLVLLLGTLALLPRWWRRRRGERRWQAVAPAVAAWAELRDASIDLGLAWPAGRSPRGTGEALLPSLAEGPVAAEAALDRLVRAIEEEWYAPAPAEAGAEALRHDVELCVLAMSVGVTPRRRFRARWLPASLVRSGAPRFAERSLADADRVG